MTYKHRIVAMAPILALAAGLMLASGCTKYASPDDLKRLDDAQKAAISAEKELEKAKADRRTLEAEVSAKEKELEGVKAELEKVKAP